MFETSLNLDLNALSRCKSSKGDCNAVAYPSSPTLIAAMRTKGELASINQSYNNCEQSTSGGGLSM